MIKTIFVVLLSIFGVFLVIMEMATLQLAGGTTEWTTVSQNIAALIIALMAMAIILIIWKGRE